MFFLFYCILLGCFVGPIVDIGSIVIYVEQVMLLMIIFNYDGFGINVMTIMFV